VGDGTLSSITFFSSITVFSSLIYGFFLAAGAEVYIIDFFTSGSYFFTGAFLLGLIIDFGLVTIPDKLSGFFRITLAGCTTG